MGKEKAIMREAEDEYNRRSSFKLAFPNENFSYYKSFFEEERPMNIALDKYFKEKLLLGKRK